jgi:hypothetical protein
MAPPPRRRLGALLLVVACVIGCIHLYGRDSIDEGDNLAAGMLMARGWVLYRDIFSHHFPFAYYWSALVAALCGPSLLAWRLSQLLFQVAAFGTAMWLTPFPIAIGIAAVVWRALSPANLTNMVLYHNFTAMALLLVGTLTVAIAGGYVRPDRRHRAALSAGAIIAILSDPLAAYPVLLSLAVLALTAGARFSLRIGVAVAAAMALTAGYLWGSGALGAFTHDVLRFNAEVYAKYTRVDPFPLWRTAQVAATGLDVFDARWRNLSLALPRLIEPDRWIFTGFLFRLAVIGASAMLAQRRRVTAAIYLYLFAALLLAGIGDERFRANAFVLVGLFAAGGLVSGEWRRDAAAPRAVTRGALAVARLAVAAMLLWVVASFLRVSLTHVDHLSYAHNFADYEQRAGAITRLRCERDDVALAYYPSDPLMHVFTGMPPVSRYLFMLPWVAEVGQADVLASLPTTDAVVSIDLSGGVWGHRTRDYLAPMVQFLDTRYVKVADGLWVSPRLAHACPQ